MPSKRDVFLGDILVTAVEGGIDYWCDIRDYRWSDDHPEANQAEIQELDEEPNRNPWRLLNIAVLETGFRLLHEGKGEVNKTTLGDLLAGEALLDAGNIDSSAADCLVQVGMFGKLIYG